VKLIRGIRFDRFADLRSQLCFQSATKGHGRKWQVTTDGYLISLGYHLASDAEAHRREREIKIAVLIPALFDVA